ncbi:MAG TPA: hypothetical protein VJA18_00145 [Candidatus Nanoarchaeia archaeon]|nr:hypothetical protein [Candidatus Nanoarchaeia archaeon]
MFRFNARKIARKDAPQPPAELVELVQQAEDLLETDLERGHDRFLRADEMYGTLRNNGILFPQIESKLDQLYVDYQMRIDRLNLNSTP